MARARLSTTKNLDPMITGERRGIPWAILNVVGGVLAIPFVLYEQLLHVLDKLAALYPEELEETAIEAVETETHPVQQRGGGD